MERVYIKAMLCKLIDNSPFAEFLLHVVTSWHFVINPQHQGPQRTPGLDIWVIMATMEVMVEGEPAGAMEGTMGSASESPKRLTR